MSTTFAAHIISDSAIAIVSHECQYPVLPSKINCLMVKYASLPIVNSSYSSSWNDTANCYITSNVLKFNGFSAEAMDELRSFGQVFDLLNGTQLIVPCKKILVFGNISKEAESTQFFTVQGDKIAQPPDDLMSVAFNFCGNSDAMV